MECFDVRIKLCRQCFDVDAHIGRRVRVLLWMRSCVPSPTLNLTKTGEYLINSDAGNKTFIDGLICPLTSTSQPRGRVYTRLEHNRKGENNIFY